MEHYIVISGDVISSTSLSKQHKERLDRQLSDLLVELQAHFDVFGRVIKGDYLECVVPDPTLGLRVALAIKAFVKTVQVDIEAYQQQKRRAQKFKEYGIRLAMGYGTLERYDPEHGIVDGEAIYFSGREISKLSPTYNKERIVIKSTLFFNSKEIDYNERFEPLLSLLDVLMSKATSRQCEVVYHKLLYRDEVEIAKLLGIGQSAVNQHSTSVGWNAIEKAVSYFSSVVAS